MRTGLRWWFVPDWQVDDTGEGRLRLGREVALLELEAWATPVPFRRKVPTGGHAEVPTGGARAVLGARLVPRASLRVKG